MSEKLSIVLVSGKLEQLQMAGMVASVGAVSGNDVTVVLTMNSLQYFVKNSSATPPSDGDMGAMITAKKAPPFRTLFEQAVELGGAKIHPCPMAMDMLGVKEQDLLPYLAEPLGVTKFLMDAHGGMVLTF